MAEQELASRQGLNEVGIKWIKLYIPPPQQVKRMTLLCKESMHLDSHLKTSAGLSCEASENVMVCEMQSKCREMRLRCGGRGCRRWEGAPPPSPPSDVRRSASCCPWRRRPSS